MWQGSFVGVLHVGGGGLGQRVVCLSQGSDEDLGVWLLGLWGFGHSSIVCQFLSRVEVPEKLAA